MKLEFEKLARSLDLSVDTLDRWIRQGRIPVTKVATLCDFNKKNLVEWALRNHIQLDLDEARPLETGSVLQVRSDDGLLLTALRRGGIQYGITGHSVEEVLENSVARVPCLDHAQASELYARLMERENLSSTGVGKGVAIPHPRNPLGDMLPSEATITACFLDHPIDFKSIDRMPVQVLFIMVCPTVKIHLSLLSRLSYCLRDEAFISLLNGQPAAPVLLDAVREREFQLETGGR